MKIDKQDISYIEMLCDMLPRTLKEINEEYKEDSYIFSSPARARFERLRIEMNKTLIKIKKKIYK